MFIISKPDRNLITEITLPSSKSISNRLLIIRALSPRPFRIENLSSSDDTRVLVDALSGEKKLVNIGHAGTAMRFLTGYYSIIPGERILTGSERMKQRPIGELVKTLKAFGADIHYSEKEGYPPVRIIGKKLEGGEIAINSSVSSQFISSLLMIAPCFSNGIKLKLEGNIVSPAYINLTLKLMNVFGVRSEWKDSMITIPPQVYKPNDITVEADWSAASYWYEMASLAEKTELIINGLSGSSLQGDSVLALICKEFGVNTEYFNGGIRLTSGHSSIIRFDQNFIDHPDLVQTFVVLCTIRGIPFRFDGTVTLRVKETDRVQALKQELEKFGIQLQSDADGSWIEYDGKPVVRDRTIQIRTYQDHRMAMAFAPAAMAGFKIDVDNPGVVSKSYPGFWGELKKAGFQIRKTGSSF